jgi:hypothetical protein
MLSARLIRSLRNDSCLREKEESYPKTRNFENQNQSDLGDTIISMWINDIAIDSHAGMRGNGKSCGTESFAHVTSFKRA